jgi:hypothetical protein
MPRGISKAGLGPSLPTKRKHDELTSPIRKPQVEGPPAKKQKLQGPDATAQQPAKFAPTDPSMHAAYDKLAHEEMMKNPKYAALANDASQASDGKPINVVTKDQVHGGMFYKKDNQIGLRPDVTGPKRAGVMAFELTNAAQQKKFDKVTSDTFRTEVNAALGKPVVGGDLNARRENFAKSMERIEYNGIQRHHEVMKDGIQNNGWPKEMDRFGKRLEGADPSFDSYWTRQNVKNKDTGNSHSDVYRKQFDGIHATAQKAAADMKAKQGIK